MEDNIFCTELVGIASSKYYLKFQSPQQSKQRTFIASINWLMQFKKIIAFSSKNHTKPVCTLYGLNTQLVTVKAGGTQG
jgi:hypothetical protein